MTRTSDIPDRVTPYAALEPAPIDEWDLRQDPDRCHLLKLGDPFMEARPRDLAGTGPRLNPDRASDVAWREQLARWSIPATTPDDEVRIWRVVIRESGRGKLSRSVPSGVCMRIFEDGRTIGRARLISGLRDGPLYELPFGDARALWRDKFLTCSPAVPFLGAIESHEVTHVA